MDTEEIKEKILTTVEQRGMDKSTCPSEIARMLFPNDWRSQMASVREVAIALQKKGKVLLTQRGKPIDITNFKGPIRIKRNRK